MSFKEHKKSTGSIKCCQSNPSLEDDGENQTFLNRNNNNMPDMVKAHCFPKKQEVDVAFDDIRFSSTEWKFPKFKKETKNILHGVSGKFKSGELSVIMGPSGAGKSTLLNILAGFITRGSTGEVKLNNIVRDSSPRFRKLSAYIPQDEELRLALTVKEAMTFAANLKLGYSVTQQYKAQQVTELLELLGLDQCLHTLTSRLSGGQRKRLAVALELLSNPPVLFLDEPTTGLDSSSCSQCIYLFKMLAKEGRTIVCTIHQPSALLFEMFDRLYALTSGKCIYDGPTGSLVPYLNRFGLKCPPYHNPADFLMEVAIGEHGTDMNALAEASKANQELEYKSIPQVKTLHTKEKDMLESNSSFMVTEISTSPPPAAAPVIMQFFLLYKRNLITNKRNYMYWINRLMAHILIGFLFGYLYRGVGANANQILANYVYMYGTVLLNVYTGKMSVTLSFPLEMRILSREHFNRWYKLTPYLLSVILIEIPFQVICTWTYIVISYWLTSQPLDFRVCNFIIYCTAATLCAQSMGYFIGATTPTKIAVFIGPVIACLFSIFGFCIRYNDTPAYFKWLFSISYFRAAFQSVVFSIYSNRTNLNCPEEEIYCHYEDPKKFLAEMDVTELNLVSNLSLVVGIWCLMHAATYLTLWLKLNKR